MSKIRIELALDEADWRALEALAAESQQDATELLAVALREFVQRRRIRPAVLRHLEDSIEANRELGRLLAQ